MSRVPMTRRDLPYLDVESAEDGPLMAATAEELERPTWLLRGTISNPSVALEGQGCWLLGPGTSAIFGHLNLISEADGKVEFYTDGDPGSEAGGSRMAYAGRSLGWAAGLVEEGPQAWDELVFSPSDVAAWDFVKTDGEIWRRIRQLSAEEEAKPAAPVVPEALDHEHCFVCNLQINPEDRFFQHKTSARPDAILCPGCYEKYVPSRDLSFVVDWD